ncbi:hypothetical protein C5B90_19080 [Haloferax sp. Atlit-12N]|nr:hypothetical protein C5B90_19080 [Haloferax sp. Atlit-12N]
MTSSAVGSALTYLMTIMFVLSIASLGGQLFEHPSARIVAAAVASIPIYGKYLQHIFPWFLSFSLIPLVLLMFYRTRLGETSRRDQVGLLILTSAITLIHPMTSLVMVGVSILALIGEYIHRKRTQNKSGFSIRSTAWIIAVPVLHYTWYFGRRGLEMLFRDIAISITQLESTGGARASRAASSGYTIPQLIWRYVVLEYGPLLLLLGLAGLVALIVIYYSARGRGELGPTISTAIYVGGGVLGVVMFAGDFVAEGAYRSNQVTILASILLVAWALTKLLSTDHDSVLWTGARVAAVVSILLLSIYAPFTVYAETRHVTEQEFSGSEWFLGTRSAERAVESNAMSHKIEVFLGDGELRPDVTYEDWAFRSSTSVLPDHYGYAENNTVGQTFPDGPYLITKTRDFEWWKREPPNRQSSINYQTREDAERLGQDATAQRIYSNGGFTVWDINGVRNSTNTAN